MVSREHDVHEIEVLLEGRAEAAAELYSSAHTSLSLSLSTLSISHSLCWTTMYHSFRSNGCLAARSGCCIDG